MRKNKQLLLNPIFPALQTWRCCGKSTAVQSPKFLAFAGTYAVTHMAKVELTIKSLYYMNLGNILFISFYVKIDE